MRDYVTIGSTPPDEPCAQVGSEDYTQRSIVECNRYIGRIREFCGPEPEGAALKIKSFPHDFGSYLEVVCYYDTNNEEAINYAFKVEGEGPMRWEGD